MFTERLTSAEGSIATSNVNNQKELEIVKQDLQALQIANQSMERKKNKDLEAMKQELQSFQVKMATKRQLLHSVYNYISYSYITSASVISVLLHETEGAARGRV